MSIHHGVGRGRQEGEPTISGFCLFVVFSFKNRKQRTKEKEVAIKAPKKPKEEIMGKRPVNAKVVGAK